MAGSCGECMHKLRYCRNKTEGRHIEACSTLLHTEVIERAMREYEHPEIQQFAHMAALQERACYENINDQPAVRKPLKPRLLEIVEFCNRMGYRRLGVAFCGGLHREASIFCHILKENNFEVVSVMCKVGGVDKTHIGIDGADKLCLGGSETMCNPVAQALILNAEKVDFNIMLGLCVGHDSLFLKYAEAMTTVFAVKDRLMGHNPLGALYTSDSYYKYLKQLQE